MRLTIHGITYERIQEKLDGKNDSPYDGTYGPVAAVAELQQARKNLHDSKNYSDGFVFVKKCPEGLLFVEGFAEALAGEIINQCITQEFIPAERASCFSPATLFTLPDDSLALVQAYAIGYKPLFTLVNENQTAKSVTSELVLKHVFGTRYDYLVEGNIEHHGLSYAMMVMLTLMGNYSWHSGNVFIKECPRLTGDMDNARPVSGDSPESSAGEWVDRYYKMIDYGASFRAMHLTGDMPDIFTSLEEGVKNINSHKKYPNQYKYIRNLFESVAAHAKQFQHDLSRSFERQNQFNKLIMDAVKKIIASFKESHELLNQQLPTKLGWKTVMNDLMKYMIGTDYISLLDDKENVEVLGRALINVINSRIAILAQWRRPAEDSANTQQKRYASPLRNSNSPEVENLLFHAFNKNLDAALKHLSREGIMRDKKTTVDIIKKIIQQLPVERNSVITLIQLLKHIAKVNLKKDLDKNIFYNVLALLATPTMPAFIANTANTASFIMLADFCKATLLKMLDDLVPSEKLSLEKYRDVITLLTEMDYAHSFTDKNIANYNKLVKRIPLLKTPAKSKAELPSSVDQEGVKFTASAFTCAASISQDPLAAKSEADDEDRLVSSTVTPPNSPRTASPMVSDSALACELDFQSPHLSAIALPASGHPSATLSLGSMINPIGMRPMALRIEVAELQRMHATLKKIWPVESVKNECW